MRQLPLMVVLTIAAAILLWNLSFYDVDAAGPASGGAERVEGATPELLEGWPEVAASMNGDVVRAHEVELAAHSSSGRPGRVSTEPLLPDGPVSHDDDDETSGVTGTSATTTVGEPLVEEIRRYPSGAMQAKGNRRGDLEEGIWTEWYENGQRSSEGEYQAGRQTGRWVYWHDNGRKQREGAYVAGLKAGRWEEWLEEGEPRTVAHYEEGCREGLFRSWYSNGQVRETGLYVDGLRTGYWEFFDVRGRQERRTGYYELGDRVR